MGDEESKLPPKVYFRIGEVASLVGVEPHVLRYWEREFRTIRPKKSARGQRVYSRKDVETLMRVRQLLYSEGFTIAGARRRLQQERSTGNGASELVEPAPASEPESARTVAQTDGAAQPQTQAQQQPEKAPAPVVRAPRIEAPAPAPVETALVTEAVERSERVAFVDGAPERLERADTADRAEQGAMRSTLRELRREIETFLAEL